MTTPQACPSTLTSPSAILRVQGLRFAYPQQAALFADWSARIPAGVSLVRGGESSGKTTLLRLLAGALPAQAGQLQIHGISLDAQPDVYRQHVFWADPRTDIHDQTTVLDYWSLLRARYASFDPGILGGLLEGLSLTEHQHKPLYMLSTGSKRKVWLAGAFASGAALTLLDEPFAALDTGSIRFVLQLLANEAAKHHPPRAWVVTHYEALGEVPLAGTINLGD